MKLLGTANWPHHPLKRLLDLVFAGFLLIVLMPLMAVVAGFVWLCLGRPLLFRQTRPGKGGIPFVLVKFRSLRKDGTATGVSRFLRATGLDELPQLWNILRGEMAFIGPRPLLVEYLERYTPDQARRHEVRPGLTGWAQVNGRNALSWADKFRHDVWYVDHASPTLDCKILARTLLQLFRSGENHDPGKFMGTEEMKKPDTQSPP